jgi:hypothetical protein
VKNRIKKSLLLILTGSFISLSSFAMPFGESWRPETVTRTMEKNSEGKEIVKTQIILDKTTSREALISACSRLSQDQVQLTFAQVSIRKSFLGLLGKSRIAYAQGQIQLPNGSKESFKAGGLFNFQYLKITYTQEVNTNNYQLNMVEIVD